MVPALELRNVSKSFGHLHVLTHLSVTVQAGESLVVMGPSGGGKSVLLKHFIGLLRPDQGQLFVEGVDFWRQSEPARAEMRRKFGVAFQEGALFDSLNVFDNVAFPLQRYTSLTSGELAKRVHRCLDLVRLPGIEHLLPSELSTGMRRRVGFARAIALEPRILLFDEPTAALDPIMVSVIEQIILDLRDRLGGTMITVTHDLAAAQRIAERMALLSHGTLIATAPAQEFMHLPDPAVQQFLTGTAPLESLP